MNLQEIARKISLDPRLDKMLDAGRTSVEGLPGGASAAFFSALFLRAGKTILIVSQNAETLAGDMAAYLGNNRACFFPSWDTYPTEDISPSKEIVGERMKVLDRLAGGECLVIAVSVKSAATRTIPKDVFRKNEIRLKVGRSSAVTRSR